MVKKKGNKFGYTRQYHISLSYQQIDLYEKAIKTQNELYQFALKYLYKTYGRKHIGRPLPFGQGIHYLNNKIKVMFIKEKYDLKRWNVKKLGLSSHAADEFLKTIFTNFSQYRKRLEQAGQMSAVEKYNLRMNITKDKDGKHKNPKHRSWYRKGSMNFLRNNNSFRTITSQRLPKGNTKLVSPHHLNVADFGEIMVFENLKHLNFEELALTKIKRLPDNTFRLQITFTREKKRSSQNKVVGADWNMFNNEVFRTSENKTIAIPKDIVKKANELEAAKDNFKSLRDREYNKRGKTTLWQKYQRKQAKLSAKRANILTETYRKLVHELVDEFDTIIIEKIDAFEMRKRSLSLNKAQNTGKNKRLALIKPYELAKIVESLVNKQNKTLIKVDPYKTSQVEYGTEYEEKHELRETNKDGKRIYVSAYTGKEVDRDYNAALNIKEWGLHPEKHVKLRDYPKLNASNLVEII
ncbi:transposase [Ligilactobacillus agilis]|uniref:RNA-guided endonuclease TnpB family protein n=1 Tax=Ligilactobacillus agilis TaxID=1601 RepID=UPI001F56F551|nr:RNA-guided endonuclease TnpB family protein [Ligilactobacillus agilis]UNL42974.1 transposase [Ligilactobacillus agilis]UNL57923.1 transposase [Ligilactobacillus agilis]